MQHPAACVRHFLIQMMPIKWPCEKNCRLQMEMTRRACPNQPSAHGATCLKVCDVLSRRSSQALRPPASFLAEALWWTRCRNTAWLWMGLAPPWPSHGCWTTCESAAPSAFGWCLAAKARWMRPSGRSWARLPIIRCQTPAALGLPSLPRLPFFAVLRTLDHMLALRK